MTYSVEDSIEGWADSIEVLLDSFFKQTPFTGRKVVFDYSKIRRKGARLKTGGGKAPGYSGLKAVPEMNTDLFSKFLFSQKTFIFRYFSKRTTPHAQVYRYQSTYDTRRCFQTIQTFFISSPKNPHGG